MVNFTCADAELLDDILAAALDRVCQAIDWDYGEVWIPNREGTLLELSPVWYGHQSRSDDRLDDLEKFKICSENFILSMNEGLPGRIWRSRKTEWINDVSIQSESYFLRNQIAKAFDIKAGFGLPVFYGQKIIGILVFFTDRACEESHCLVQLAVSAATLLRQQPEPIGHKIDDTH
jgi:GAF domain-containing protein